MGACDREGEREGLMEGERGGRERTQYYYSFEDNLDHWHKSVRVASYLKCL